MREEGSESAGTVGPHSFPIGSPASRAAARAETERRLWVDHADATIVFLFGSPRYDGICERSSPLKSPDSIVNYGMLDGSVVSVKRLHHESGGKRGITICIGQTWADGREYDGDCPVKSLSEIERLGRRERR
jgi:hypothetical protein